jgi:hypothetical protein
MRSNLMVGDHNRNSKGFEGVKIVDRPLIAEGCRVSACYFCENCSSCRELSALYKHQKTIAQSRSEGVRENDRREQSSEIY